MPSEGGVGFCYIALSGGGGGSTLLKSYFDAFLFSSFSKILLPIQLKTFLAALKPLKPLVFTLFLERICYFLLANGLLVIFLFIT